jgi:hypothetical protein
VGEPDGGRCPVPHLKASGPASQRKLVLRTLDAKGKERWPHEIAAAELPFPK